MAIKVRGTSRLLFSRTLIIDGVECFEMPEYPLIEEASDDEIYQVKQKERIDLIANRKYGNPELWWVIAVLNDLNLLPSDLAPFSTIRLPSNKRVFSKILKQAPKRREGR